MPKLLIIIVVAFILLSGGAIAVMQQMEIGPFAASELDLEASKEAEKKKAEEEDLEPPRFVNMQALTIPIIQEDRVYGTIQLQLQIETTQEREAKLKEVLPILRDTFIRDLHAYLPRMLRKKKTLDTTAIKNRLEVIGRRTVGKDVFDAVLIQSAIDRPSR